MLNRGRILTFCLVLTFLAMVTILGVQDAAGPAHWDFVLTGSEPATLYLPPRVRAIGEMVPITPPPVSQRPPGVVLVHGYSADRVGMSVLARRIAQNGYGVLAIDLHGHGANRNPFSTKLVKPGVLY